MNKPETNSYSLEEGEVKVTYRDDAKLSKCGIFMVNKEDHTIGNSIRAQLLRDKRVLYAGYQISHPLFPIVKFKVRTTDKTDPAEVFGRALTNGTKELENIQASFTKALKAFDEEKKKSARDEFDDDQRMDYE